MFQGRSPAATRQAPPIPKRAASPWPGMESQGDPRVLSVLNLLLSFVFSLVVVWGLSFIDLAAFSWTNVGLATLALFLITWVVVLRR